MKMLLQYAVPPLVGAVIGFITNVVAIKMLFRPLNKITVFGIRVPFTPGVLPRQRHKLADSIGTMVQRELLTPELLRSRLAQQDVQQKLKDSISLFTEKVLGRDLGSFFSFSPDSDIGILLNSLGSSCFNSPGLAALFRAIKSQIYKEAEKQYHTLSLSILDFLRNPDVHRELEIHGRIFLSAVILKLNVFQRFFISAGQYDRTLNEQMPEIIDSLIDQIHDILREESVRLKFLTFIESFLDRHLGHEKTIPDFLASVRDTMLKEHGDSTIKTLLSVGTIQKEQLDCFLCSRILFFADKELDKLLEAISVKTMVSQRINELDMIRVENIILDVMANQFKWIDIFGAILGFLIGIMQVCINQFLLFR